MTTITKPDQILRVAVAGQRELPEAARDGLARRLDAAGLVIDLCQLCHRSLLVVSFTV